MQVAGALDAYFAYDGPLGCEVSRDGVALRVWAPTATRVRVLLWGGPGGGAPLEAEAEMRRDDPAPGVWSAQGPAEWVRHPSHPRTLPALCPPITTRAPVESAS